ncbi:MAG: 2-oxoglutarate dehydrogenase E1 component [Alphaproteobacteria bacterium]|nr:2-oxoglutarate dehydrogenase E1 component [Alphaproteobacteria bacterium]
MSASPRTHGFEDRLRELSSLYTRWTIDENSVAPLWQKFFADLETDARSWLASFNRPLTHGEAAGETSRAPGRETRDALRVALLIRNYRIRGHFKARLDPLGLAGGVAHPDLDPATYGFEDKDLKRDIYLGGVLGQDWATLEDILATLDAIYCGPIGAEFMHIQDPIQRHWLTTKMENRTAFAPDARERKHILERLIAAEEFERFLAKRFAGTKRFGLDGAETTVPALEQILRHAAFGGVEQVVLGMPHRGRLNVLANVMDKPLSAIFAEFRGESSEAELEGGSGDVKYHLGTSTDRTFAGRRIHLSLTANPSHLEAVDPLVLGKARAKQRQLGDHDRTRVLPLLLHGDAAFAGQGMVAETLDLSDLSGYRVGGTIHFIVNNQIGFTTNPVNARSGPYCSDLAKATQSPIFHVNGENPEAVTIVARLAAEYRQRFHRDIVLDLFCYRRFGHNEMDEPSFTQPRMYREIRGRPLASEIYAEHLVKSGDIDGETVSAMRESERKRLADELESATSYRPNKADWLEGVWSRVKAVREWEAHRGDTAVAVDELRRLGAALVTPPPDFAAHPKIEKFLAERGAAIEAGEAIDWATGEALAFASLAAEGHPVRMSGQDCNRGTFTQRHASLIDQNTERQWWPLKDIAPDAGNIEIVDSPLSEFGVLGYEYGYALADPDALVLWEAQFGDFANGAQVIIDQFLSASEAKWLRMSGIVLLLPHGFEGQGPEHSSARLERFLQLCANDNMQVVNCTTPANYFHVLRRQLARDFRKPLIVMTPKSLLRDKRCVSPLSAFGPGSSFHRVLLEDQDFTDNTPKRQVVFCSGKVYYDLAAARDAANAPASNGAAKPDGDLAAAAADGDLAAADEIAIVRLEQIYPWPSDVLIDWLAPHRDAQLVWCQEEPRNMGAWGLVQELLAETAEEAGVREPRPRYAGRRASAAVATGLMARHRQEQEALVREALTVGLPPIGRIGMHKREEAAAKAATTEATA